MNVLVIGGGGREHALVWKLAQSPRISRLFCAPGNAGMESRATCVALPSDDVAGLLAFAKSERIDLTVVGPEAPLALGIVDDFRKAKLRIFGPTRNAARIESSKAFAKDLMVRHGIPTPAARTFDAVEPALAYLDGRRVPIVVKADGLAQGKGVIVAGTREAARDAIVSMLQDRAFGGAGSRIVIEDFLDGEEVTIMAFTDGHTIVPMVPAQDHKRAGDGDTGANTGGMGAYAPAPIATPALVERVVKEILRPAVDGLSRVGSPFQGVLYAGLMIVKGAPYVLEFNARFGDPETEVVLPLLNADLLGVLEAVVDHRLDQQALQWHHAAAVCVVLASGGYPGAYATGLPISGLQEPDSDQVVVFHAGTKRHNGETLTAGGRVLGVTAVGPDLSAARERAYERTRRIAFEGRHCRSDIALRAVSARA